MDRLDIKYAFAGGVAVGFLLDNPALSFVRPTKDVDAIVSVVTRIEYTDLEESLRGLRFANDFSEGAPICRWIYKGITVDIMPAKDPTGHMSDIWFEYALKTASMKTCLGGRVPVISATCFLATKFAAFHDRGKGDFASHDLEDIITVIDGRDRLLDEIRSEERDKNTL